MSDDERGASGPQPSPSIPNHCAATRKDGRRCTAPALPGQAYCFAHSPALAAKREAARAAGGKNKATAARLGKLVPASLRPVLAALMAALEETHAGNLDPKRASAMAALAGAIVRVYQAGELEERVAALEARGAREEAG